MKQENKPIETYYFNENLAEMVFKRFGKIRFFGSQGTLPPGYKPFARIACHDYGIVYGFLVAYINGKRTSSQSVIQMNMIHGVFTTLTETKERPEKFRSFFLGE